MRADGAHTASYGRFGTELLSWSLLAVALGAVDGGVIGVMLKNLFAGAVDASRLNFSVAFILGAPHFCNVLGFLWPHLSRARIHGSARDALGDSRSRGATGAGSRFPGILRAAIGCCGVSFVLSWVRQERATRFRHPC